MMSKCICLQDENGAIVLTTCPIHGESQPPVPELLDWVGMYNKAMFDLTAANARIAHLEQIRKADQSYKILLIAAEYRQRAEAAEARITELLAIAEKAQAREARLRRALEMIAESTWNDAVVSFARAALAADKDAR